MDDWGPLGATATGRPELRRHLRLRTDESAELRVPGQGLRYPVQLQNLSLGGALLRLPGELAAVAVDDRLEVLLTSGSAAEGFWFDAVVVRRVHDDIGVRWLLEPEHQPPLHEHVSQLASRQAIPASALGPTPFQRQRRLDRLFWIAVAAIGVAAVLGWLLRD